VLLGVQMCRQLYGAGPWDDLATAWKLTHPLTRAAPGVGVLLQRSEAQLPKLSEILVTRPMRAFGGRSLAALIDPARVHPAELQQLARAAGPSLFTSPHWAATEPLRITALTGLGVALDPEHTTTYTEQFRTFSHTLSSLAPARAAA
jgi:hypothetical protein